MLITTRLASSLDKLQLSCPLDRLPPTVGVLGVDGQAHNVVGVTLKHLYAFPALLPVPELDCHVIGGGQDEWLRRVDHDRSDIVGVGLKGGDALGGVVVVDAQLKVVRTADDPVLPRYEATGADRDIGKLEGFDDLLPVSDVLAAEASC